MVGEEEVLAMELELMLVVESATDLDLSLFTFCRNFGSFEDECGVDGVGEELDGEWRDLLEDIVSRLDYVPTRLQKCCRAVVAAVAVDKLGNCSGSMCRMVVIGRGRN